MQHLNALYERRLASTNTMISGLLEKKSAFAALREKACSIRRLLVQQKNTVHGDLSANYERLLITLDELLRERVALNDEAFRRRANIVDRRIDEINKSENDLTQLAQFLKRRITERGSLKGSAAVHFSKDIDHKTRFVKSYHDIMREVERVLALQKDIELTDICSEDFLALDVPPLDFHL